VEPVLEPVAVNELVRSVLSLARFAPDRAGPEVRVQSELAADLPECLLDPALVSTGLENLLRNGFEAMPDGGVLTVRTAAPNGNGGGVVITVQDTGTGMDARRLSRATDDFYTTKATGSGLGLAFTQRVAAAHGGTLRLSSVLGRGTVVELHFPVNPPANQST
jgi:two-component system sensor histidine kinase HydH